MSFCACGAEVIRLIQRVSEAAVRVDGRVVGEVGPGLLALVHAERGDIAAEVDRPLERLLGYRVFPDAQGEMNLPVHNTDGNGQAGGLLAVSQFTLAAGTRSGTRPSFMPAAAPEDRRRLYGHFAARARAQHPIVATGEFGADMKVSFIDGGPATFWLQIAL